MRSYGIKIFLRHNLHGDSCDKSRTDLIFTAIQEACIFVFSMTKGPPVLTINIIIRSENF